MKKIHCFSTCKPVLPLLFLFSSLFFTCQKREWPDTIPEEPMELEGMHESSLSGLFSDFGDLGRSSVEAYTRSDTSGFGIRVMGGSGYSFQVPDYSALDTARIFKIIAPGGTSYILPVRQQESGQVSFQNLVIYKGEHGQATFLVTNHPDAEWVDQYRESGEFYHFRGKINVRKLSGYVTTFEAQELEALLMSSPGSGKFQSYSNQQCFIISQYIVTEYRCTCAGQHTLAQIAQCTCTQEGGLAPHYQTNAVPVTVCFGIDTDVDPPGVDPGFGGGGGNGVPIGSIPPEDYGPIGNIGDLGEQLAVQLSITNPQVVNFLNNNPDIALSLHNYLQAISAYDPNANAFGKWTAEFLAANTTVTWAQFENAFIHGNNFTADFSNLNSPINHPKAPEIHYAGISLSDVTTNPPPPQQPKPLIGRTTNRGNTEDMQWGTNGNASGIDPFVIQNYPTDGDKFFLMTDLFNWTTALDSDLRGVSTLMIDKFQSKTGGTFENNVLNQKVKESTEFRNFLRKFGENLQSELQESNGNMQSVINKPVQMLDIRPIFNGSYNKFRGLQILINDTEYTEVRLESITDSPNGQNWNVVVEVTIRDHFGLDKNDALTYQGWHSGFAAWWLLQHTRGYKPFETVVKVRQMITIKK